MREPQPVSLSVLELTTCSLAWRTTSLNLDITCLEQHPHSCHTLAVVGVWETPSTSLNPLLPPHTTTGGPSPSEPSDRKSITVTSITVNDGFLSHKGTQNCFSGNILCGCEALFPFCSLVRLAALSGLWEGTKSGVEEFTPVQVSP